MTPEQFLELPERQRAEVLARLFAKQLESVLPPPRILPPKYDRAFTRKRGQFVWMSEMDLRSLKYWYGEKLKSAASGSQYSEKDAKTAEVLERWITWRTIEPLAPWSGTRGKDRASAMPPNGDPVLHAWSENRRSDSNERASSEPPAKGFSDYDYGVPDESDIPF